MNLLQDIFKILHQPVQLLIAALMFAYKEPKRKFWPIRAVLTAILGFLVLKLCITASPEILLNSFLTSLVWSIGSFLILLSIEYSMFDVKLKMAAYFTTLAYLTQHVAFCAWDAIQPGAGYNEPHYCSLKDIVVDMGETFAQEAVAMKIAALYAPAMNIHRSPFSGRNYEYYSEDGLHSGKMAAAETQGIQSQGVTTYCKHFAVNDQESNRDSGGLLTWVNEQAMREIYIKPFEIAVKEGGTRGIMSSFNRIGEICAAENADLLTTVLRNEWGFRGTVITDCILQLSYINIDRAIVAGNDLILSLMNMQAPSEAVTNSPAGHQVLRTATHNILYTSANSIGQEVSAIPVPYWLYITVAVVDAGLIALCVFYFVRRRKNVKRWKEQNSVQA